MALLSTSEDAEAQRGCGPDRVTQLTGELSGLEPPLPNPKLQAMAE